MKRLSSPLRWGLGLSLVLSAWALLSPVPEEAPPAAAALPDEAAGRVAGQVLPQRSAGAKGPIRPLRLEPSLVDLFAAPKLAQPEPSAPPPAAPLPSASPAPAAPAAPALAGQMWTPEGQWLVFMREGEQTLPLQPGQTLSSGYRVESLQAPKGREDGQVLLWHPPSDTRLTLRVPIDNR